MFTALCTNKNKGCLNMHRKSTVEGEIFFSVPHVCVHVHAYLLVCVCVFFFFFSKDTSDNPNQAFYGKEKYCEKKTTQLMLILDVISIHLIIHVQDRSQSLVCDLAAVCSWYLIWISFANSAYECNWISTGHKNEDKAKLAAKGWWYESHLSVCSVRVNNT